MPPKKEGKSKGGKEEPKQANGAITEVEKTLLELQIAECNRKIARLRTAVDEYEVRNDELQKAYDKLDEDRADIIAYLKKVLTIKTEENNELKEKVKGLEDIREIETAQFKETVAELEKDFAIMKEQLTAENKLLAGKLNTLEEFRAIRDDLMRKFEKQEQDFKDQEVKYKTIIYEAEKKFVISKDKLKKEMEERLLQLAQDFQDATELRIAASTHRVIRENIAINHELDKLLAAQAKLADQNEKFRESERGARVAKELAEEERDKTMNKNLVQLKVINKLTHAFQMMKNEKILLEKKVYDLETLQTKLQECTKDNERMTLQMQNLEENLHAQLDALNKTTINTSKMAIETEKLKKILKEAALAIKAALKLDQWANSDPSREIMDRQALLSQLLEIVTQYREIERAESVDMSYRGIYKEGDLGFIAKPATKKISVFSVASYASKDKENDTDKPCYASRPVSSSSLGSIKTTPSFKLETRKYLDSKKDCVESLISSAHSGESSKAALEKEYHTAMTKQLEASKLEIKKSIMKDLAYSQMAFRSHGRVSQEKDKVSKSVVIVDTVQAVIKAVEEKEGSAETRVEKKTVLSEETKSEDKPREEKKRSGNVFISGKKRR